MNYGNIKFFDVANGPGVRTSVFVSGCRHHCVECFQPETWNFEYGEVFSEAVESEIVNSLKDEFIKGLTVLGGEPMEPENQETVLHLLERVRRECTDKDIWIYSGFTFEELTDISNKRCHTEFTDKILHTADTLVDGEFHIDEKNLMLNFRGSSNQRIIDLRKTFEEGSIILSPLNN